MGQKEISKAGAVEPGCSTTPAPQTAALVHNGDYWTVAYGGVEFSLKNISGLSYIQTLLQNSGQEFHALDLLMGGGTGASSGNGNSVSEGLDYSDQLVRGNAPKKTIFKLFLPRRNRRYVSFTAIWHTFAPLTDKLVLD
jgi:hypothetical protein